MCCDTRSIGDLADSDPSLTLIKQYVVDMENPAPAVRSRKPLRAAQITVEDVEGQPGWYRCGLKVRPQVKYRGASITLSLVGKLGKT